MEGKSKQFENGRVQTQDYGLFIRSPSEGKQLAAIQAQARDCLRTRFHGESTAPGFSPGARFNLQKHYRESWDKPYLLVSVAHTGHQTGWFASRLSAKPPTDQVEAEIDYHNSFTAIDASLQYRMLRQTPGR